MNIWYERYMKNAVNLVTIDKLVAAGKITQEERDKMVADRLEQYGY